MSKPFWDPAFFVIWSFLVRSKAVVAWIWLNVFELQVGLWKFSTAPEVFMAQYLGAWLILYAHGTLLCTWHIIYHKPQWFCTSHWLNVHGPLYPTILLLYPATFSEDDEFLLGALRQNCALFTSVTPWALWTTVATRHPWMLIIF